MPSYEFECNECGTFTKHRHFREDSSFANCPQCQAPAKRLYTTLGVVRAGSLGTPKSATTSEHATSSSSPYDVTIRDMVIFGSGGSGIVANGTSMDIEGAYIAGNAGGDVKISNADRVRFVDNTVGIEDVD